MKARVGDLAIAKFDGYGSEKYDERLCIIIRYSTEFGREFTFAFWKKGKQNRTIMELDSLPPGRLRKVTPRKGKKLVTNVCDLTINDVIDV